jgi:hypothetical protein
MPSKQIYEQLLKLKKAKVALINSQAQILMKGELADLTLGGFSVNNFEFNLWEVKCIVGSVIEIDCVI